MRKNKKGFTLVELLAVIVILAIIALIVIPTVGELMDQSRRKAFVSTTYGLIKAAEQYYSEKVLIDDEFSEATFEFPSNTSGLEFKGTAPESGTMLIDENGDVSIAVSNGRYCARKGKKEREVLLSETESDCSVHVDTVLNGAEPVLKTGMIPVIIAPDGTVTKASTNSKWHDYANKEWANAVTVTEETRKEYLESDIGTTINEEDILTYFVWIPRYKYKLWYTEAVDGGASTDASKVHSINIVFEDNEETKSEGTSNGQYLTHPAFTFGDEELDGVWVGKFETGYNEDFKNLKLADLLAKYNKIEKEKLIIKPNKYSWRYINASNMYFNASNMNDEDNVFGFASDSDTHMMKNTEWGAVAYLSHSKYGKNGEVYINNNSASLTGCGGDSASETNTSTCKNKYGTKTDNVYNQSTTGNISGIFDMSGGSAEYIMAYTIKANPSNKYASSGFTEATFPTDTKYVSLYTTEYSTNFSKRILGDATGEMGPFNSTVSSSWYNDSSSFLPTAYPFMARGNRFSGGVQAGIFAMQNSSAVEHQSVTSRVVIS